jgi:predicted DNA-binding transcriptional regulator AlpA
LERAGEFPERIRLTEAGSVGWYEDEIDNWVRERIRAAGKRPPRKAA